MKITLDNTRSKLCEGRSEGIGFGFLKQESEGFFSGVQPISPCKDYLNDVVYTEATGKSISVWGLTTKKAAIFDGRAHLAIATCYPNHSSTPHDSFEDERKAMVENLPKVQKMFHLIEDMIGIADKTELVKVDDNLVYAKLAMDWVGSTYAISLWSFLFRNYIYATSDDPFEALKKTKDSGDALSAVQVINKLKAFIAKKALPTQNMDDMHGSHSIHNNGIISYSLPK